MRLVFRVDASLVIGTGHVMRCITLADELARQGHECQFICREHTGHLGDLIVSKGHGLILLPRPVDGSSQQKGSATENYEEWLGVPWQEDADQTLNALSTQQPDWLVVDHYALDEHWECMLSKTVDKIMVIDDLANRRHECALLLDQNLGRVESDYDGLLPVQCKRLIGPKYSLLRPEFAKLRAQSLLRRKSPKLSRILISLGGVDRDNMTGEVLKAFEHSSLPASTELDIVMGASAPYLDQVREQAEYLPIKASVNVDVQNMAERMCLADLSIGAAGGTSWERACLGLPAVMIVLADNQVCGAKALGAFGAAKVIGKPKLVSTSLPLVFAELSNAARLKTLSNAAANITDGTGVFKVVSNMSKSKDVVHEQI